MNTNEGSHGTLNEESDYRDRCEMNMKIIEAAML